MRVAAAIAKIFIAPIHEIKVETAESLIDACVLSFTMDTMVLGAHTHARIHMHIHTHTHTKLNTCF